MPMLRPRDFDDLVQRTGLELQADADRTQLGPHGALDRKGRPVLVFFVPKPPAYEAVLSRFTKIANAAKRIGAELAEPLVVHVLDDWLVFVERASGEELCLADWLVLRPGLARRRQVAKHLQKTVVALHAQRLAHGAITGKHVLVGQGTEVVLAGASLRALQGDESLDLAVAQDAEALRTLLHELVGDEALAWTHEGFVPPDLAATGTLTLESPLPISGANAPPKAEAVDTPAYARIASRKPRKRFFVLAATAALAGAFVLVRASSKIAADPVAPSSAVEPDASPAAPSPSDDVPNEAKTLVQDAGISPESPAPKRTPPPIRRKLQGAPGAGARDLLEDSMQGPTR